MSCPREMPLRAGSTRLLTDFGAVLESTWCWVKQGGTLAHEIKWSQEGTEYAPPEAMCMGS